MKSTSRYNKADLLKLREALLASNAHLDLPDVVTMNEDRHQFIKDGRAEVRFGCRGEIYLLTKQPMQFLKTWVRQEFQDRYREMAWDVFAFLFHVPLEFVPTYLDDSTLTFFGLVQWRLDNGK